MRTPRFLLFLATVGCGGNASDIGSGVAALGGGWHVPGTLRVVATAEEDRLDKPQDLGFNPDRPEELWVVNRKDDSVTILFDPDTPQQTSEHRVDPYAEHFMDQVTSIAFGDPNRFSTCQDSLNTYNDTAPPNFFMGPTLWPSKLSQFGETNPDAVMDLGFDLGSHVDMLHESPQCVGVAWDHDNVYWVFDGYHGAIVRYDFQDDHGMGYDDHSDGLIHRWMEGDVKRSGDAPAHLVLDHATGILYVADAGNHRILAVDTSSGRAGDRLFSIEPGTEHLRWDNADWWVLVDNLDTPVGIALVEGVLLVTDRGTSLIHAFDLDGNQVDWMVTGLEPDSLAGIEARSLADVWFVDSKEERVYHLQP